MVRAQDLNLITRPDLDPSPPEQVLQNWLRAELSRK
jgi:hypothetical protein